MSRPSLAIGVLSSACQAAGLDAPTEYHGGLRFAELLLDRAGGPLTPLDYTAIADSGFSYALGDWVFAGVLNAADFGLAGMRDYASRHDIPLRTTTAMRELASTFVDIAVEDILGREPEVVGFSTTFMQNVPSLAVAKRLKERAPAITVLFGGGNCAGPMGPALHREFEFVDLVLSGEADETLPQLLRALGKDGALADIAGLCWRDGNTTVVSTAPARLVPPARMHAPDYTGWFDAFDASPVGSQLEPELTVESARGCWWGERHHCTFCGLNQNAMEFRAKPPDVFVAELGDLVRTHRVLNVTVVDNILSPAYLRTALPELSRRGWDLRLHYEVKANLTADQIEVLRKAGVYSVQPGIESLVDDALTRMRKGVRAARNVRTLRDCESAGLTVAWNWLYGFPGERPDDYGVVIRQLPALVHLQPPGAVGRIELERFSPNFEDPGHGFPDRKPAEPFGYVYDVPHERLRDLVYVFETTPRGLSEEQAEPLTVAVKTWVAGYPSSTLVRRDIGDTTVLRDRRVGWPETDHILEIPRERHAWAQLEHGRTPAGLARQMAEGGHDWDRVALDHWLNGLRERGLVFVEGGHWVALATSAVSPRLAHLVPTEVREHA